MAGLTEQLKDKIPGTIWHVDLPNDGSNILVNKPISHWRPALIQAISALEYVILVAHSTLGMFVQTMPELEEMLSGLVLIGSAPDASWQTQFDEYCVNNVDSHIAETENAYEKNPGNETLRQLVIASAKRCFVTENSLTAGQEMMRQIPVNYLASKAESQIFDSNNYKATWIPQKLKTLILNGSNDYITPFSLFEQNQQYHRENITLNKISGAGHYPWFENANEVIQAVQHYADTLHSN